MILHHEFIKNAKRLGGRMAIIDRTTDKRVTYSKALIASLILAKKFRKYPEGFVGVMIPTSAGAFLATLGVLMAGKVPVMINYSTGAADNCEYAQNKCGFRTIITSRALLERIRCPIVPGMVFLEDLMTTIGTADKLAAALRSKLPGGAILRTLPPAQEDDDVVILFTSGSEKEPKAVELTHRNIGSNVRDARQVFDLHEENVLMAILPLFHVFGYTVNFWLPLMVGMTAVTCANPLDYKNIPVYIREEKATMIAATPIFFAGYLRESKPGDFETLRLLVAGADKTPELLREGYWSKHRKVLLEGYGCTETSPVVSVNTPEYNRPGSIGLPLPSVQVKIVDVETGRQLPPNKEGKILVKGDLVMKGYFDDLEETSLRIRDGWYDTGDMGVLDEDGYLWHRGRLKRFVKIGGEMVSLVRTEVLLEKLLPEGVSCCVVDVPESKKGAKIVAAVTRKVDERAILKALAKELPAIALPKQFVVLPDMPKMGSGKVDFRTVACLVREEVTA
ncbi:MAG: AMP-binding protein [bacterium]|jgi:acyl-[acyl-carrier-protein]-phospholipid O-acyltransferase/long-chain-fatty-acid--[acyl-carrier-protein] ligase|nr:AMP-binding protein [candidate division KSB1 bacterium]MDH7560289.1 AMP-binding protein [bacterium]